MDPPGELRPKPPVYSMSRSVPASKFTRVFASDEPASPWDGAKERPWKGRWVSQPARPRAYWVWASACPPFWKFLDADRLAPVVLLEVCWVLPEPSPAVARARAEAETTLIWAEAEYARPQT